MPKNNIHINLYFHLLQENLSKSRPQIPAIDSKPSNQKLRRELLTIKEKGLERI